MVSDRNSEHFLYRFDKMRCFLAGDGKTPARGIDLSQEQGFAGIDIPQSGNLALIKQERLDLLLALLQQRPKISVVKACA